MKGFYLEKGSTDAGGRDEPTSKAKISNLQTLWKKKKGVASGEGKRAHHFIRQRA